MSTVNENIKSKVFSLRMSQKEYDYIKAEAEKNHCTIGQYIRMIVLKGVVL